MVPENILWAFFSDSHYSSMAVEAKMLGKPVADDTYYKGVNGKWVRVTAVFDCINVARKNYRYNDLFYLGGVFADTKSKISRGDKFVSPELKKDTQIVLTKKKKKKISNESEITNMVSIIKNGKNCELWYDEYGY